MSKKIKHTLEIIAEIFGMVVAVIPIIRIFRRRK